MKDREERLLDAFLSGNDGAFDELVSECRDRLYRTVMRILQNHDDTLDTIQDSLVKAYKGVRSFRRESSFSTWLTAIAVREAINRIKRDRFRSAVSLHLLAAKTLSPGRSTEVRASGSDCNPGDPAEVSEAELRVREAVESLPAVQRAVFAMKYYEGLKMSEIAEIAGITEGAAKASYFHALRKLRERLSPLVERE